MADEHRELRQPDDIDGAHRGMQQQRPGGEQHEDQSHPAVVPHHRPGGDREPQCDTDHPARRRRGDGDGDPILQDHPRPPG